MRYDPSICGECGSGEVSILARMMLNSRRQLKPYGDGAESPYCHDCGADTTLAKPEPCYAYVNVYAGERLYGGPEEGGWYFDAGTLLKVMRVPIEPTDTLEEQRVKVMPLLKRVSRWCDRRNAGSYHRSSVVGDADYEARWEVKPGKDFPEEHPHYE